MINVENQIELVNIQKNYGTHVVLSNCDLCVRNGEFVVVVGRSGSGKSTLLNLIGGLEQPTDGTIKVSGNSLTNLNEEELSKLRRQKLGFIFQFFNLIPTLTALENIRLPMALNRINKKETIERALSLLEEFGLSGFDQRFPEELSGGEQQRVAIARALAHKPDIILADEPTGNLDLDTANEVLELLNRTCRQRGTTLIMATHSKEVIGLADRVFSIHGSDLNEAIM
ncbi:MAG: ABC transporter ATP-binding protein [Gammaproteobacteria bacterium]|nr:ABC transporter ATP-binding protein [Gammaproteobacteria bacterium]|tara:strand:- start:5364 stop:6044 length:681 start_codon:yes stop_codon:yes gene_type:complete